MSGALLPFSGHSTSVADLSASLSQLMAIDGEKHSFNQQIHNLQMQNTNRRMYLSANPSMQYPDWQPSPEPAERPRNTGSSAPRKADRAAVFRGQFAKTRWCCFYKLEGGCKHGAGCHYAHSVEELQQRPQLQKTSLCKQWQKGTCRAGDGECTFAHGHEELRMTTAFRKVPQSPQSGSPYSDPGTPDEAPLRGWESTLKYTTEDLQRLKEEEWSNDQAPPGLEIPAPGPKQTATKAPQPQPQPIGTQRLPLSLADYLKPDGNPGLQSMQMWPPGGQVAQPGYGLSCQRKLCTVQVPVYVPYTFDITDPHSLEAVLRQVAEHHSAMDGTNELAIVQALRSVSKDQAEIAGRLAASSSSTEDGTSSDGDAAGSDETSDSDVVADLVVAR